MWMSAFVPALWAVALIFLPGLLVTLALRLRTFDALALAPALSVALIATSAILAPMLGRGWNLIDPLSLTLIVLGLGILLKFFTGRLFVLFPWGKQAAAYRVESSKLTPGWFSGRQAWAFLAWVIAVLLLLRNVKNSLGRPEWISQTWDNNFHLNAIRFIVDHNNGSSLFISSMTSGGGPATFYPAAWHDLVSLVFMLSGASIPVATNVVVLVVTALVWPLSVLYFVRSILSLNAFALIATALVSASIVAFPFSLLDFGVLYPNILGYSLLPLGLGLGTRLLGVGHGEKMGSFDGIFLGIFVCLGIALAHPNAIMSLLVLALPLLVTRLILQIISAVKGEIPWYLALAQVLGLCLILVIINFLWGVVRPPQVAGEIWGPDTSQGAALGELFTNQALGSKPLWLMSILFLIGAYFLVKTKSRLYWVFAMWIVFAYFYVAIRSLPWDQGRYQVVGTWYHDSYRLAALIPVVTIPFISYGVQYFSEKARLLWKKRAAASHPVLRSSWVMPGVSALVLLAFLVSSQSAQPLTTFINKSFWAYAPSANSKLLDTDELRLLSQLEKYVPAQDKIIVDAYNGSTLAYAYTGRQVSAYHTLWSRTPDETYLYQHLKQAKTDPKVCQIINQNHEAYYLDFGSREVNGDNHSGMYPGLQDIEESGVVQEVYRSGHAVLYKITVCG